MGGRINIQRDRHIATITIANAERRNALSVVMWNSLGDALLELSDDEETRCIILTGEGDRAFASGADISTFHKERNDLASGIAFGRIAERTMSAIANCRHPVVAAIRGACVGGGLEVAVLCDIRISGKSGRFGIPAMKLGLNVGLAELSGLLAVVGTAATLEILLEGRIFDAQEAFEKLLISRVVEDEAVEKKRARRRSVSLQEHR
jgi:enoyl-CoA hydratase